MHGATSGNESGGGLMDRDDCSAGASWESEDGPRLQYVAEAEN